MKGIILLDPWLFPLSEEVYKNLNVSCPILFLANERFVRIKDVFERNKKFIEDNYSNTIYVCWKEADHLQQTDSPFVMGTSLGKIKNIKNSRKLYNFNMQAIHIFL